VDDSSEFRIFETNESLKRLAKLPEDYPEFIREKLDEYVYPQLKQEAFFGPNVRKLRGYSPDVRRYRIGRFRLFYAVDLEDRVIYILSVDLRREAYRRG
jgi:mRNA interferase RelE/StbE